MSSEVFRPRLPLDPFSAHKWFIQPPTPTPTTTTTTTLPRHIVLILGATTHADLAPLASSSHLNSSLLILATHTPPPLRKPSPTHSHKGPAILILHLPAPLAVHDAGAVRLVSLLERAQRAVAAWLAAPAPRIQQFGEDGPGGEFIIPEEPEFSHTRHSHPGPKSSSVPNPSPLGPYATGSSSPSSSFTSLAHTVPHSKPKHPSKTKTRQSTPIPFTALLSFLPSGLPEKSLLKHAILVTTLSAPFLSTTPVLVPSSAGVPGSSPSNVSLSRSSRPSILAALPFSSLSLPASTHPQTKRRSRLSSLFSASSHRLLPQPSPSLDSLAHAHAPPPACKPHLVHVLPYSAFTPPPTQPLPKSRHRPRLTIPGSSSTPSTSSGLSSGHSRTSISIATHAQTHGKTKLVQSIEQFLLSFAYPLALPSAISSRRPSSRSSVIGPPVPTRGLGLGLSSGSAGSATGSGSNPGSGLGSGSTLRGSRTAPSSPARTAPSSPSRTAPIRASSPNPGPASGSGSGSGLPSAYHGHKSQSTSALARPASSALPTPAPSAGSVYNPHPHPHPHPRAPSSSASSVASSYAPRSRPASTYSTYSTYSAISGISQLGAGTGEEEEGGGGKEKGGVVPYLVPAGVMGCHVPGEGFEEMSVGEAVVLGLVDEAAAGEGWPRAWIGEAGSVAWAEGVEVNPTLSGNGKGKEREGGEGLSPLRTGQPFLGPLSTNGGGDNDNENDDEKDNERVQDKDKAKLISKSKSKSKTKTKMERRVRRNEAGLPTPPESSSSLDSESESEVELLGRGGTPASTSASTDGDGVGDGDDGDGDGDTSVDGDGYVRVRRDSGFDSEGGEDAGVGGGVGEVFPSAGGGGSVSLEDVGRGAGVGVKGRKKRFRIRVSSFFGRGGRSASLGLVGREGGEVMGVNEMSASVKTQSKGQTTTKTKTKTGKTNIKPKGVLTGMGWRRG